MTFYAAASDSGTKPRCGRHGNTRLISGQLLLCVPPGSRGKHQGLSPDPPPTNSKNLVLSDVCGKNCLVKKGGTQDPPPNPTLCRAMPTKKTVALEKCFAPASIGGGRVSSFEKRFSQNFGSYIMVASVIYETNQNQCNIFCDAHFVTGAQENKRTETNKCICEISCLYFNQNRGVRSSPRCKTWHQVSQFQQKQRFRCR